MHSIDLPPITTFTFTLLVLLFLFSVLTTTSLSSNETFSACNNTFNCGHLVNVSYPFTGGDRPARCGHPDFQLSCVNNSTELTIDSLTYRVLRLDPQRQTLTVARLDLWNQTCPQKFVNSSLVSSVFSFGAGNMDLTIAYHCDSSIMTFKPSNLFQCNVNGLSSDSYFLVGAIPSDPILSVIRCNVIIRLPILDSVSGNLTRNRSMLAEALMEGFNVNYSIPHSNDCSKCLESGGQCGYDDEPICICGDRLCPKQGKNSNNVAKIVGLSIAGVCILSIVIGCFVCFLRQRRNKRAILAKDKSLLTPPSSKSDPTSSINLSQSIPSYFTSKSDLEKGSTYFGVQVFTYTELEEATNHFDPSKELGDGGFGTVYYGILQDGRVVAVKRLYENNFKRVVQFMNEVEILTRLEHQNLVKLYGCTSRRSRELLLVYEYIPNGTVADHLHGKQSNSGLLTWQVRLSIAIETADALSYLHRSDIIHRDVKTNNILLDNDFRVKVADFGLSRLFPTNVTHVSTAPQGTPGYVDPEYYQCYQLTDKSDVYSFGVVLIELISSLPAVDTNRHRHDINLSNMAINKIQNHAVNELIDPSLGFEKDNSIRIVATTIAELAFRCLQQEKDMRPTMEEVLVVLKAIKNKDFITEKAEVVDIRSADIGLLKGISPPLSPDSNSTDKWMKMGNVTL